ncbi:MAG TPA: HAD-IA family hydrolase [Solirubrobacteraceae bacterium]|nr:HAD-IA family hydrolase [Solirubrobacteraceae bacterium]
MALGGVGPVLGEDVEAVLLDGLGTLVALEPPRLSLTTQLRENYGLELALADAERAFRAEMAYYRAHHHEARDRDTLDALRRRCAEVLGTHLPAEVARALSLAQLTAAMLEALRFSAYPDAAPALRALRAGGLGLLVVSNWDISLPAVLCGVGLEELVDGVVTSARVGSPKPEGAIFAAALTITRTAPGRTVHVGDSVAHDVLGALAAGIRPVLLCRDAPELPSPRELEVPPPGVPVISSLEGLLA